VKHDGLLTTLATFTVLTLLALLTGSFMSSAKSLDRAMVQSSLLSLKRVLISARTEMQEAHALAERIGDKALAERLASHAGSLANELDYLDNKIARAS
jgi:hypothetical protein